MSKTRSTYMRAGAFVLALLVGALFMCIPGAQGAHVDPTVVATISTGSGARGVGVNTSTGLVYVANLGNGTVSVVDGNTDTLVTNIPSGGVPVGVDVDPTSNRIYVADFSGDSVFVIECWQPAKVGHFC